MTAIKLQFSEIMDYIETCESGELLGLLVETFTPLLLSSLSVEDPVPRFLFLPFTLSIPPTSESTSV